MTHRITSLFSSIKKRSKSKLSLPTHSIIPVDNNSSLSFPNELILIPQESVLKRKVTFSDQYCSPLESVVLPFLKTNFTFSILEMPSSIVVSDAISENSSVFEFTELMRRKSISRMTIRRSKSTSTQGRQNIDLGKVDSNNIPITEQRRDSGGPATFSEASQRESENKLFHSLFYFPRKRVSATTKQYLRNKISESFDKIKNWEKGRVTKMNNNRKVCDIVFNTIKERIAINKQGLRKFQKFFQESAKHTKAFAKKSNNFTKLDMAFFKGDEEKGLPGFQKVLKESDAFHTKFVEKHKFVTDFNEEEIIKGIFIKEENRLNQNIIPSFDPLLKIKADLVKEDAKTARLTQKYIKCLKKTFNFQKTDKDLLAAELAFLKQAKEQTLVHKKFAEAMANLVTTIHDYEIMFWENLGKGLELYTKTINQFFGGENANLVLGSLSEINIQDEINKVYGAKMLLNEFGLKLLKESTNSEAEEPLIDELVAYLRNIQVQAIGENSLVIRSWQATFEEEGKMIGQRSSNVGLTLGRNIIVYDWNNELKDSQVYTNVHLSEIVVKKTANPNSIGFMRIQKGLIWKKAKHFEITFLSEQERQSFIDIYLKFSR